MLDALGMAGKAYALEIDIGCGVEVEHVVEAESTVEFGDLCRVRTNA